MKSIRHAFLFVSAILCLWAGTADAQVRIVYDPDDGNLAVIGETRRITTFEVRSSDAVFECGNITPGVLTPPFDICYPEKLFKLESAGFTSIDFGSILPIGLTERQLTDDLNIDGSLFIDGSGENGLAAEGIFLVTPEPGGLSLAMIGLIGLLRLRRR